MKGRTSRMRSVFILALVDLFIKVATPCSEAVTDGSIVLNMCEDGTAVGEHVAIDTYGSSAHRTNGGSINCSCTATLTGLPDGTRTTIGLGSVPSLYPRPGCGSSLIISMLIADFPSVHQIFYPCTVTNTTLNLVQTNDTVTVVWNSGPSGSTSGYCFLLRAGSGSSLSVKCNSRETTTKAQLRTTTSQSRETTTQSKGTTSQSREITTKTRESTTQSRETTTQSRQATTTTGVKMTTHSMETTTYSITNSGSTTLGQKNNLQQCYQLSAVVVPLVVTSLLIAVTVVVHLILYRKRLALVKQPEYTEAVMTSPNPVHYDSLDLSRVEPPNLYADTSTGQTYVNTAMTS